MPRPLLCSRGYPEAIEVDVRVDTVLDYGGDQELMISPRPGRASHDIYRATRHFGSLDGLRCLAVIPVVWHHASSGAVDGALSRGPLGVDLFFAISGFLITTLLVRERDATGTVAVGSFFVRRSLRIFPLYYAVLAFYTLHAWLLPREVPQRAHFFASLPFFATYTTDWFVSFDVPHPVGFAFSWSLAVEEQFYALWPWIVRVRAGFAALAAAALLALDQLAERGLLAPWLPAGSLAARMATSIATPICLGALLAVALHRPRLHAALGLLLGHRLSAPLLLAATVACVVVPAPLLPTQVVLALLVGACVAREDNGLRPLLTARPVRHIGAVSYGIYMLHVAVTGPLKLFLPAAWRAPPVVFALALPACVGLATLSHHGFEARFLRLRERFRAPPARGSTPAV